MLSDRCLSVCLSVYLPCLSRLLCWRIVVKRLVGLMPLDMEVGLGPGHIVLDGDPAPPKWHSSPPTFRPMYCGQMAGWIKMLLGT